MSTAGLQLWSNQFLNILVGWRQLICQSNICCWLDDVLVLPADFTQVRSDQIFFFLTTQRNTNHNNSSPKIDMVKNKGVRYAK